LAAAGSEETGFATVAEVESNQRKRQGRLVVNPTIRTQVLSLALNKAAIVHNTASTIETDCVAIFCARVFPKTAPRDVRGAPVVTNCPTIRLGREYSAIIDPPPLSPAAKERCGRGRKTARARNIDSTTVDGRRLLEETVDDLRQLQEEYSIRSLFAL
jgi:hypothetical protein